MPEELNAVCTGLFPFFNVGNSPVFCFQGPSESKQRTVTKCQYRLFATINQYLHVTMTRSEIRNYSFASR